jgi:hypothetical protein
MRRLRSSGVLVPAVLTYVIALTLVLVWRGISVSPDYFVFILLFGAVVLGRWKAFIVDWMPFVALFIGYEFMRGLAGSTGISVHYTEVIAADRAIGFGQVPTIWLQQQLYHAGRVSALDVAATFFYFLHFAYPLALGYVMWIIDRRVFRRYAAAFLLMSFAAFVFFLLVPVAPPWLASQKGSIGHVAKIIDHTLPSASDWLYQRMNPNKVAAMPSLHAAFPVLGMLYAVRLFGVRAWCLGVWCLAVFFSITYLGEHYVIDAIAGAALAVVFYFVVEWAWNRLRQSREADARIAFVDAVDADDQRGKRLQPAGNVESAGPDPAQPDLGA